MRRGSAFLFAALLSICPSRASVFVAGLTGPVQLVCGALAPKVLLANACARDDGAKQMRYAARCAISEQWTPVLQNLACTCASVLQAARDAEPLPASQYQGH